MMLTWDYYHNWLKHRTVSIHSEATEPPHPERINTDSRTIRPGDWFLPLEGENFDGHKFIGQAMHKGASGFFFNQKASCLAPSEHIGK